MSQKNTKKCHRCKPGTKKIASINSKWKLPHLFMEISPKYAMPECSPDLQNYHHKKANLHEEVDLGEKYANRIIFYFAAHQHKLKNCDIILHASKAYGDLSNQGVARTDNKGKVVFSVKCPQGYREEGNTYISHIHFVVSNKKNTKWIPKMKAQRVTCHVSHKVMKKTVDRNCAVVLNALPVEYHIKDRIPNSYSLPYQLVKDEKLTRDEVVSYVKSLIKNYPRLEKSVKNKKLKLMEVPIVVYCYKPSCNASEILHDHLIKMGFKNVREYKLGILGWRNKLPKTK